MKGDITCDYTIYTFCLQSELRDVLVINFYFFETEQPVVLALRHESIFYYCTNRMGCRT